MKKRIIWKMLVLTIVTIGIYRLYWFIKTRREMMNLNPNVKILSPFLLFLPFIFIVVSIGIFIASLGSIYDAAENAPSYCSQLKQTDIMLPKECTVDSPPAWGIGLIYLSILLFYPLIVVWLWGYSKGVETITGGHTSFAIALIVLLLVPDGIDILIVQDGFNKLSPTEPPAPTTSSAPTPIAA